MSTGAECALALARAVAAGTICVLAGLCVRALMAGLKQRVRTAAWAMLLVPYLTPVLLVGYAYSNFSLSLVRHPVLNELFYDCLVWMKLVPVAALVWYLAPSPLTAEALHCRRLLLERKAGRVARLSYLVFAARGSLRCWGTAFALTSLLAFGEFEMASLFGIGTWTVSLFDAHAGGLALAESLRLALPPLSVEAGLLVLILLIFLRGRRLNVATPLRRPAPGTAARLLTWGYLTAAGLVVTIVPAAIVLRGTLEGLRTLAQNFVLGKDIGASLVFAATGATCAYLGGGWITRRMQGSGRAGGRIVPAVLVAMPGLLGPLVLSLGIVFAFQAPLLRVVYDTPLPLVLTLCLLLLPFAILLRILLRAVGPREALHLSNLLGEAKAGTVRGWRRRLVWELKTRRQFWVAFLLFCWGYFDLTASAILSPPAMTPATVRLYNLMHYGQSAVLSAMVCVTFCVPVILILAAEGTQRLLWRLSTHA